MILLLCPPKLHARIYIQYIYELPCIVPCLDNCINHYRYEDICCDVIKLCLQPYKADTESDVLTLDPSLEAH